MSEVKEVLRWQLKGFIPGVEGVSKAVLKPWVVMASDFDAEHALRLAGDHQVEKLKEQLAEVVAALETSHTALTDLACLAPQHRTEVIDQAIDQAAFTLSHAKAHPINSDHRGRINE